MRSVSGTPILKEAATVYKYHARESILDRIRWLTARRGDDDGTGFTARYEIGVEIEGTPQPRACSRINAMQTPCKLLRNLFFDSHKRSRLYSQPYIPMKCRRYRLSSRNPRTRKFELISLSRI